MFNIVYIYKHLSLMFFLRIFVLFFVVAKVNAEPNSLKLSDLQQLAEQRLSKLTSDQQFADSYAMSVNTWLAGPATLQINALRSSESMGNDEIEVSLSAPVTSPTAIGVQDELGLIRQQLNDVLKQERSLFYSGVARQALWDKLLAENSLEALQEKLQWMDTYGSALEKRQSAEEVSRYGFLLWKQQRLQVASELLAAQAQLKLANQRYETVFGTLQLPVSAVETATSNSMVSAHPVLQVAALRFQLAFKGMELASANASPWQVGIIARQINSPSLEETQLGLTLGIPLGLGATHSLQDASDWEQTKNSFERTWVESRFTLQQQLSEAASTLNVLNQQAALLEQQVTLGQEITAQLNRLKQQSELEQSAWLTEQLHQIDLRHTHARLRLLSQQQVAKLNQIAGISL